MSDDRAILGHQLEDIEPELGGYHQCSTCDLEHQAHESCVDQLKRRVKGLEKELQEFKAEKEAIHGSVTHYRCGECQEYYPTGSGECPMCVPYSERT